MVALADVLTRLAVLFVRGRRMATVRAAVAVPVVAATRG
jgi:hypothetical protein